MSKIESSVDVDVPVRTAYNQWTQFEQFPSFMEGVESVEQLDDSHLRWRAEIAGKEHQWDAVITEQVPDQRIAWTTQRGPYNSGLVTFRPNDDGGTQVTVELTYEPQSAAEKVGAMLGILKARVHGDLERFRDFIEARGAETGAYRGTIRGGRPTGE